MATKKIQLRNTLSGRIKNYEEVSKTRLMRRTPVIIRLDGRAFHTLCRDLDKPYDYDFHRFMENTMLHLCSDIQGCVLGYTQSDEITLVLIDYQTLTTDAWFDYEVQKLCSVSASMATAYFNGAVRLYIQGLEDGYYALMRSNHAELQDAQIKELNKWQSKMATFDARCFNLPRHEVANCLIWRQQDATRNSILSLAQSLMSHKNMQGKSTKELQNIMLEQYNVNWNDLPTAEKRGCCCIKTPDGWAIDYDIPVFTQNREYIEDRIYLEENTLKTDPNIEAPIFEKGQS